MKLWAAFILIVALIGTTMNLVWGTPLALVFPYIILLLTGLGLLVWSSVKTQEGDKEETEQLA